MLLTMNTNRFCLIFMFVLLLFAPMHGRAQEFLTGVAENAIIVRQTKALHPKKQNRDAVRLPFLEDFSNYVGYPDPALWGDRQAFVNNTFPIYPPSLGVATLDALNEYGRVYAHADREAFPADTLTSVCIRLDSNFAHHRAMSIADSLYFSFFYQPGGGCKTVPSTAWERIGDEPETDDELILEFGYATGDTVFVGYKYADYVIGDDETYIAGDTIENDFIPGTYYIFQNNAYPGEIIQMPCDSLFGPEYVWNRVWSSDGCSLDDWLAENPLQYFKQVMIPIDTEEYLRDNFQFRFRNYASLDVDSWSGNNIVGWTSNCDQWHLDYIRLNTDRHVNDLYPNDVAFVSPVTTALKDYQAMPWNQFRPSDMAEKFHNDLSNLSNTTKNTYYNYTVVKNNAQPVYSSTVNNENAPPYYPNGLHTYPYHAAPDIDFSYVYDGADSAFFTVIHIFRMEGTNDECIQNDTCIFEQKFYNYYAYDDGTAEGGYCLLSTLPGPQAYLAVRFDLAEPDTLRCVRMWFNRTPDDENFAPFSLMVWDNDGGLPGNVLCSLPAMMPAHAENYTDFINYYLDEPLPVSGSFFVGFYQNNDVQLNLGFDQNNDARGKFFYKTANDWHESYYRGAPMIRPVLGKFYDCSGITRHPLQTWNFYPNPTSGLLYCAASNSPDCPLQCQLYDIYGRLLGIHEVKAGKININTYPAGVYIVKIVDGKHVIATTKIIKK